MCGFTGIINFDPSYKVERTDLEKINGFNAKRGPDNEGFWIKNNIGFAHSRLSILDLNSRADQPMINPHSQNVLVYNGEIYNYRDIKAELEQRNIKFITTSDSEVILEATKAIGIHNFLEKTDGMFAFALYDDQEKKIFFARDRFGEKPLYYILKNNFFCFASDIRSLWSFFSGELNLDHETLDYYFSELSSPQPKTIWKEIKQLPPASYGILDLEKKEFTIKEYWQPKAEKDNSLTLKKALEKSETLIRESVNSRMISDVEISCFLSSGADSGLVTSFYSLLSQKKIKTFTAGFDFQEWNEMLLAKKVSQKYNTNHTEIHIHPDIINSIKHVADISGEPFADSSAIPTFLTSAEISKRSKVAFTGDGGDEIFGGYYNYLIAHQTDLAKNELGKVNRVINYGLYKSGLTKVNKGLLDEYFKSDGYFKLFRGMGFDESQKKSLFEGQLKSIGFTKNYLNELWTKSKAESLADTLFIASLKTRLLNDYLVKTDRMSMEHSLELRPPFLNHKLFEFSMSIPNPIRFHDSQNKYILKELSCKYIDPDFKSRKKLGFGIPAHQWIRKELRDFIHDHLFTNSKIRTYVNLKYIKQLIDEHQSTLNDHTDRIWSLLMLELWLRKYT
jgi:asparagine synthase (glutamine-hydrolysing)